MKNVRRLFFIHHFFSARGQQGKELVRMKRLYIEGGNGKGVGEGDEEGGDRGGMTAAAKRITAMNDEDRISTPGGRGLRSFKSLGMTDAMSHILGTSSGQPHEEYIQISPQQARDPLQDDHAARRCSGCSRSARWRIGCCSRSAIRVRRASLQQDCH
jgi:hypothetical protein